MSDDSNDNVQVTNADDSAVISVDGLIGPDDEVSSAESAVSPNSADLMQTSNLLDTLNSEGIVPNETVKTNDRSVVGEAKPPEENSAEDDDEVPDASTLPFGVTQEQLKDDSQPAADSEGEANSDAAPILDAEQILNAEPAQSAESGFSGIMPNPMPDISMPVLVVDDPAKLDFIKTYSAEYDETLSRAADVIGKILDCVDESMRDKLSIIRIPEEASEFLEESPEEGQVHSFEEVRIIVKTIMDCAVEAKKRSKEAATEAGQIYDEVQIFKKETKDQIAELAKDDQPDAA